MGSIVLGLFLPTTANGLTFESSFIVFVILILAGLLRGIVWLLFNSGVQQIGASSASVLFLSASFFTVVIQATLAALFPTLALHPASNLFLSLIGGVVIAVGVALWETQALPVAQPE